MKLRLLGFGALGVLVFAASHAQAVVKHAADDSTVIPGPHPDVVGRWNTNASAVAIAPNYIITARHPDGNLAQTSVAGVGVGTIVEFGGIQYKAAEVFNHPTADLRVVRIETLASQPANLADFVPVYATPLVSFTNFTMGGFGKSRGADLTTTGGTYAYNWLNETNTTERFGRNIIESNGSYTDGFGYTNDIYGADFDGTTAASYLAGESIVAEYDSGGGWFIEDGPGNWKVAALSHGVEHSFAQFADASDATIPDPDGMDAVNLSTYATFISAIVPEPGSATIFLIASGLLATRRRRAHH